MHGWQRPVLSLLRQGEPGAQAEVVVLGATKSIEVGAGVVPGPPSQVLVATLGWAPLCASNQPQCSSPSSAAALINTCLGVPEQSLVLPGCRGQGARMGLPHGAAGSMSMAGGHTRLLARRSRRSRSLTTSAP